MLFVTLLLKFCILSVSALAWNYVFRNMLWCLTLLFLFFFLERASKIIREMNLKCICNRTGPTTFFHSKESFFDEMTLFFKCSENPLKKTREWFINNFLLIHCVSTNHCRNIFMYYHFKFFWNLGTTYQTSEFLICTDFMNKFSRYFL